MEGWSNIIRMLSTKYPWAWFPVVIFMIISSFVLLNLVIAVLCEALSAIKKMEEDEKASETKKRVDEENQLMISNIEMMIEDARTNEVLTRRIVSNIQGDVTNTTEAIHKLTLQIDGMQKALVGIVELQMQMTRKLEVRSNEKARQYRE